MYILFPGEHLSDSDDDIEDVLAVPSARRRSSKGHCTEVIEPHAEIELEVDDETLAAIEKGGNPGNHKTKETKNKDSESNQIIDYSKSNISLSLAPLYRNSAINGR